MFRAAILIITALIFIIGGCSSDSNPASSNGSEEHLILTDTIGVEGGVIGNEDITLAVPPGLVDEDVTVKLYKMTNDFMFDSSRCTETYTLKGIPAEPDEPIKIYLKYQGSLTNRSYIAIGRMVEMEEYDSSVVFYDLMSADDSSGYLMAEYPETGTTAGKCRETGVPQSGLDDDEIDWLSFLGITDRRYHTSDDGHFRINYPGYTHFVISELAGYLEGAYHYYHNLGYRYLAVHGLSEDIEDIEVTVYHFRDIDKDIYGPVAYDQSHYRELVEKYDFYINFNAEYMNETYLDTLRIAAGQVFFDVVRLAQIPQYYSADYWFHKCVSLWYGSIFSVSEGYIPNGFAGNEIAPFNGIQHSDFEGRDEHIAGMTPFFEYMKTMYDNQLLVNTYDKIRTGQRALQSFIESAGDEPNEWWPGFFLDYVSGYYYDVDVDMFASGDFVTGTFNTGTGERAASFEASYQDLSARVYMIELDPGELADGDRLALSLASDEVDAEDMKIVSFEYGGGETYCRDIVDTDTINNVYELACDGYDLMAVVVNAGTHAPDYEEESDITINMDILEPLPEELDYNYCKIFLSFIGTYTYHEGETNTTEHVLVWEADGSFTDNVFTGTATGARVLDGSMTVVVNPYSLDIISFEAEHTRWVNDQGRNQLSSVSGNNIPRKFPGSYHVEALLEGPELCDAITSLVDTIGTEGEDDWDYFHWPPTCDEESSIWMYFEKNE